MKLITGITVGLFAGLVFVSFGLSYEALMTVAQQNGKDGWRSVFWPLLIDGGLVIFSLSVLWAQFRQESTWLQWCLVVVFTGATVAFNYVQAPDGAVARAVAVTAPVVLFLAFERLMAMLRSGVQRDAYLSSLDNLETESVQKRAELSRLSRRVKTLQKKEVKLAEQPSDDTADRRRRLRDILAENPDANKTQIARRLGVARSTIYTDLKTLEQEGVLSPNGRE